MDVRLGGNVRGGGSGGNVRCKRRRGNVGKESKAFSAAPSPDVGANKNHHHTVNANVNSLKRQKNWKTKKTDEN